MFANLILGLRDIWKHKIFFMVCIAFLVVFVIVLTLITVTFYLNHVIDVWATEPTPIETFELVYTQYDFSYAREVLEGISSIYEENAVSMRLSQSLTSLYGRDVYLVFGDGSVINAGIANQEGISVYAYDAEDLEHIEILGVKHGIELISFSERLRLPGHSAFQSTEGIFVVYQGEAMIDIIHLMSDRTPERFFEIIGDTWILVEDSKRIGDFTDYVANNVEGLSFKDSFHVAGDEFHKRYIDSFLLPLTIALSLTGILSFLAIFQGMLQRMQRDLTIHLQSGARFRDVLLRFYVFYGAIIGVTLAILYAIGVISDTFDSLIIYGTLFIIAVSISIYIARALKRTNLFENLRGDMV